MPEPKCLVGNYQEFDSKCQKCTSADVCKDKRQKIRKEFSRIIIKSGVRRWFLAYQQALGDLMLSHPGDIVSRIFFLFEAFEKAYGVTRKGLTGLISEKLHTKAIGAELDLHKYQTAMKNWDNHPNSEEYEIRVKKPLRYLEKKYGANHKVDLTEKPAELLECILLHIKIELVPEMEFIVDNVSSLMMDEESNVLSESDRFKRIDDPQQRLGG